MTDHLPPLAALEHAEQAALLLRDHAITVARYGIGVAPSFKQELNRVIARQAAADGADSARPVEGVTAPGDSRL